MSALAKIIRNGNKLSSRSPTSFMYYPCCCGLPN